MENLWINFLFGGIAAYITVLFFLAIFAEKKNILWILFTGMGMLLVICLASSMSTLRDVLSISGVEYFVWGAMILAAIATILYKKWRRKK